MLGQVAEVALAYNALYKDIPTGDYAIQLGNIDPKTEAIMWGGAQWNLGTTIKRAQRIVDLQSVELRLRQDPQQVFYRVIRLPHDFEKQEKRFILSYREGRIKITELLPSISGLGIGSEVKNIAHLLKTLEGDPCLNSIEYAEALSTPDSITATFIPFTTPGEDFKRCSPEEFTCLIRKIESRFDLI